MPGGSDRAVGELAAALPISRPAVSQHLKVLKNAGLVSERVAGTRRIYRLDPAGVAAMRDQLDTYWSRALAGFQDVVASPTRSTKNTSSTQDRRSNDPGSYRRRPQADRGRRTPGPRIHRVHRELRGLQAPRAQPHAVADRQDGVRAAVGGHIVDLAEDGSECRWARVLVYEPHDRIVFSWDIGPDWQLVADPDNASEVEVRFIAETPERTRVELEHRHIDRHGPGWEAVRDGVDTDQGWPLYLDRYAAVVASGS